MPKTVEPTRYDNKFLTENFSEHSRCELDEYPLHDHEWAEFDKLGYVNNCDKVSE